MPPFDTRVPALLLRLDSNPFHHGTLGAARSLGRAGIEVHALLAPPCGPVTGSRHLHRIHPTGGSEGPPPLLELLRTLRRISGHIGRPAVLLPMDDLSALAVARLADRLTGRYLLPPTSRNRSPTRRNSPASATASASRTPRP
jgi:hypothetical protein